MFGLVRFADNSYWIYSMKNIIAKDCKDDTCLVKHKGAKYEAVLIATNEKKQHLEFIQQQEMSKSCEPVEESSSENIFMDCSIGIDYVDINRPSNYVRHSLNESVLHISSGEQDHTGHLLDVTPTKQFDLKKQIFETERPTRQKLSQSGKLLTEYEKLLEDEDLPSEDKESSEFEENSEDDPNYELSSDEESPDLTTSRNEAESVLSNIETELYGEEAHRVSKIISDDISKIDSFSSSVLVQLSSSLTVPGCDDNNMKVMASRGRKGDKKHNFCLFCHTKQQKIARHLESKHKEEEEVKKFIALPKGNIQRANIIGRIRKQGNFLFNTNENYNDGELIVSRRPQNASNKGGKDFRACANCKGFFSKQSLRVHFKSCTGIDNKTHRLVTVLSRKITGRIHPKASQAVKNHLFPPLRDDDVSRTIRFDELIIIFANKMVEKYREPRHFQMIRQRIRLLGKFLINIRKLNSEISNLTSVYDPKFVEEVTRAINICAKYSENSNSYEAPSVAFSLGTLLKQIGSILVTESIKNHADSLKKNTKDFLKVFAQEVNINVNRTVVETQLKMQRRKSIILPSMSDIKRLCNYLTNERNMALNHLNQAFSVEAWLKLAESTLTSIQLFNRRRAGEVERITIADFETYQTVEQSNIDLFRSLSEISKNIAKKYVRFTIRGKLNRTVPVLLDTHLFKCIKLILKYRTDIGVSKRNPYVFGIPGVDPKKFSHLQACNLMRKFSEACGAEHPNRLRGTNLRKHIATACITLNLESQDISDLSNFMGHSENIHKGIYRQPIVSRDILGISKLLEAAQGVGDGECSDDENTEDEDNNQDSQHHETFVNRSYNEVLNSSVGNRNNSTGSKKRKTGSKRNGTSRKARWTDKEKQAIFRIFGEFLKKKELPSLKMIQSVIKETPVLQNRTSPQIKTWIHNQFKFSKKKLSF